MKHEAALSVRHALYVSQIFSIDNIALFSLSIFVRLRKNINKFIIIFLHIRQALLKLFVMLSMYHCGIFVSQLGRHITMYLLSQSVPWFPL